MKKEHLTQKSLNFFRQPEATNSSHKRLNLLASYQGLIKSGLSSKKNGQAATDSNPEMASSQLDSNQIRSHQNSDQIQAKVFESQKVKFGRVKVDFSDKFYEVKARMKKSRKADKERGQPVAKVSGSRLERSEGKLMFKGKQQERYDELN